MKQNDFHFKQNNYITIKYISFRMHGNHLHENIYCILVGLINTQIHLGKNNITIMNLTLKINHTNLHVAHFLVLLQSSKKCHPLDIENFILFQNIYNQIHPKNFIPSVFSRLQRLIQDMYT
jgi:hypothetical protein